MPGTIPSPFHVLAYLNLRTTTTDGGEPGTVRSSNWSSVSQLIRMEPGLNPDWANVCLKPPLKPCRLALPFSVLVAVEPSLRMVDIWGWKVLCFRDCPVHWRMFRCIPGPYPPPVAALPQVITTKNVSRHWLKWGWGRRCRTTLSWEPWLWKEKLFEDLI